MSDKNDDKNDDKKCVKCVQKPGGTLVVHRYYGKTLCVVLGKERSGRYKHKYNLFVGKRDSGENSVENALRELWEETCKCVSKKETDTCTKYSIVTGGTRVYAIKHRGFGDKQFQHACKTEKGHKFLEMLEVRHFSVSSIINLKSNWMMDIKGKWCELTDFAINSVKAMVKYSRMKTDGDLSNLKKHKGCDCCNRCSKR